MNRLASWIGVLLISALVFCGAAAAYNVTDCTVENTNVYAGSSVSLISPIGTYDPLNSFAESVTSDPNVYVRPVDFTATVSNSVNVLFKTGIQGARVTLDGDSVVTTPYVWDFGIGSPETTDVPQTKHTYPAGEYTAKVTVSNYLDTSGESASVPINILYSGYDSYQGGFVSVLSMIIVAALVAAVVLLLIFIKGGGDFGMLIPFTLGVLGFILVLIFVVFIAGWFDNVTMGVLSRGI